MISPRVVQYMMLCEALHISVSFLSPFFSLGCVARTTSTVNARSGEIWIVGLGYGYMGSSVLGNFSLYHFHRLLELV